MKARSTLLNLVLWLLPVFSFSQNNSDSLLVILKSNAHDTVKINALKSLSQANSTPANALIYCSRLKEIADRLITSSNQAIKQKGIIAKGSYLSGLGYYYDAAGKSDSSIYFFDRANEWGLKYGLENTRAESLNGLGMIYQSVGDNEKAIKALEECRLLFKKLKNESGYAYCQNNIAYIYQSEGNADKALSYFNNSLKIFNKINEEQGIAYTHINIGYIYRKKGDVKSALEHFHAHQKLVEKNNDLTGMASAYNNIGALFKDIQDTTMAKFYYQKSYETSLKGGLVQAMAVAIMNIGQVMNDAKNYPAALANFRKSLGLNLKANDKSLIASNYGNLGNVYFKLNMMDSSELYYNLAYKINKELNSPEGLANNIRNIATIELKKGNLAKAEAYAREGFEMATRYNYPTSIYPSAYVLSQVYKARKNTDKAFYYYEIYVNKRDSLNDLDVQKSAVKQAMRYNYEKKSAADSLNVAKERIISDAKLKQEESRRYWLIAGLVLIAVFSFFIYKRFLIARKQKVIIENQKILVDVKNKEITDSINYAYRLQKAIFPSEKIWNSTFKENFILYKPKDIVAGDFYWLEFAAQDKIFVAAADSTGHGVPGAMVSIVCSNALNRAVKEFDLTDPGKILDKARELVVETFSTSETEVKDGMDISLMCIDKSRNKITWSGANNPLWYIENDSPGLKEIKGDKQPIGKTDHPKPFVTHELDLKPGTTFYLFTDGFGDQFGGPKGKKFKNKQLQELVLANATMPLSQQSQMLDEAINTWKGSLEQIDDICFIGIRI
ncbi:MAG: tetratricopeptide repeat protein [Bacteroidia bacterium]|nr:tetratricopeptide repeat protein [Bacteroidia bacterium]